MKTAADFARASVLMREIANQMKPDSDSDPFAQARKLIQFHLQSASAKTRDIAEALAKTEAR